MEKDNNSNSEQFTRGQSQEEEVVVSALDAPADQAQDQLQITRSERGHLIGEHAKPEASTTGQLFQLLSSCQIKIGPSSPNPMKSHQMIISAGLARWNAYCICLIKISLLNKPPPASP
jgi:hypothetical protein